MLGYDGQFHQLNRRSWGNASVALPDGRGNLFCLHSDAAYSLPFNTNLCTYTSFKDMSGRRSLSGSLIIRFPDKVKTFQDFRHFAIRVAPGENIENAGKAGFLS